VVRRQGRDRERVPMLDGQAGDTAREHAVGDVVERSFGKPQPPSWYLMAISQELAADRNSSFSGLSRISSVGLENRCASTRLRSSDCPSSHEAERAQCRQQGRAKE
jgi:hypothetical protein